MSLDAAARPASRWRLLGVVAPGLDARTGLLGGRHRRAMADPEVRACMSILRSLPDVVAAWSDGNVTLEAEVVVADAPLARLARVGGGWWADPGAAADLLEPHLARPRDSVILLYPSDGDPALKGAWGYTWGEVGFLGGAGFSAIVSDPWPGWATIEDPAHGFVHEWLHQVEAVYHRLGISDDDLPSLHDVADRRTTREDAPDRATTYVEHERRTGSWRPWYRDFMTGTVGPKTGEAPRTRGLTRERWLRRRNPA
ncbi:MAG: hypothetical protein U0838_17305 [Chloroflexota bacterium]